MPGPGYYNAKLKSNGAHHSLEKKSFNKNYGLLKDHPALQDENFEKVSVLRKNSKKIKEKYEKSEETIQ